MGLIREIQEIRGSIDKRERARRQKERQKILVANYNDEIINDLKASFTRCFQAHDVLTSEELLLREKDTIIEDIAKIVENITYTENGKKYYTYKGQFDIVGDLYNNYYKILQQVKKEFTRLSTLTDKRRQKELESKLYNNILFYFKKYPNELLSVCRVITNYDIMKEITRKITSDEIELEYLEKIYLKTYNNIKRYYNEKIKQEKENNKQAIYLAKQQAKNKKENLLIFNLFLSELLLIFKEKKKRR